MSLILFVLSTAFFIWWQFFGEVQVVAAESGSRRKQGRGPEWPFHVAARPTRKLAFCPQLCGGDELRELELDLDAFEGPFDLLLTLVLREELPLAEVDVAGIVLAFVERLADREELDLDACGEFLVLVAALLELKARGLFAGEAELEDLEPGEAAEELARRLEEYRRIKGAAEWLAERLASERDRFFRLGPAPLAPRGERRLAEQDPVALAALLRALAAEPPESRSRISSCAFRRCRGSSSSSGPSWGGASASISTTRWPG